MLKWIEGDLGSDTVLHISRYHPTYLLNEEATKEDEILKFYHIANEYLDNVYLGNLNSSEGQNTFCPNCTELIIKREDYNISLIGINEKGHCKKCNHKVLDNFIIN